MHFSPPSIASIHHSPADKALHTQLQHTIDFKTKPQGALGQLEALALQLGCIQQSQKITFNAPQMLVFAGDHGITAEGVSAFPAAVTQQMVANMLSGGAAVNVFARQHGFAVTVVDAGVAGDLQLNPPTQAGAPSDAQPQPQSQSQSQSQPQPQPQPQFLHRKIAPGTQNACITSAMTATQATAAVQAGMDVVRNLPGNVLALGEMGIGNTSSAALVFALLSKLPVADVAGRGTGLDDAQMQTKLTALRKAQALHANATEPMDVLAAVGGFEIAMMVGAMLQAASQRRVVLVDGFIASAAALVACRLAPQVQDYMVFCHVGAEHGHAALLAHLKATPLLGLGLRLGEGTGALLAWPLLQSAALFLAEMASFEAAGVDQRS
jgi:nicotinate-nucleotide--dimethylbenzimidazole phosphoribosyltransferase